MRFYRIITNDTCGRPGELSHNEWKAEYAVLSERACILVDQACSRVSKLFPCYDFLIEASTIGCGVDYENDYQVIICDFQRYPMSYLDQEQLSLGARTSRKTLVFEEKIRSYELQKNMSEITASFVDEVSGQSPNSLCSNLAWRHG